MEYEPKRHFVNDEYKRWEDQEKGSKIRKKSADRKKLKAIEKERQKKEKKIQKAIE